MINFEFYCPHCGAGYIGEMSGERIDRECYCDDCEQKFRLQVYVETVIETSKKLKETP